MTGRGHVRLGTGLSTTSETRRYRVLGVLGKGGFGIVYHARLEGADGFVKDVAIKLLTDRDPGMETLYRFRDEARILGRVRDRGIVSVDPPTRLDGRWAVVMEYVDGIDCRRLVKEVGPLPPMVALGIVEEVARTLHNLWHHPGEDGQPIQLLHRDLKPANIQVTPSGAVKLLDFGVARAEIGREWYTTNHIAGTLGYIAPERLRGIESPEGDVYSLGVVLEELITGRRPVATDAPVAREPVLALALQMRAENPMNRPTAAEVEARCHELQASALPGPRLREWAQTQVRQRPHQPVEDPLVGQTLSETFARLTMTPIPRPRKRSVVTGIALAGMLGLTMSLLLGMVGGGVVGLWWWSQQPRAGVTPLEPLTSPVLPESPAAREPAPPEPQPEAPTAAEPPPAPPSPRVPRPREPVAAQGGRVGQEGADSIELLGPAGRFGVGLVPAGTYKITARFGDTTVPAGEITVEPGEQLILRCDRRFQRCLKP